MFRKKQRKLKNVITRSRYEIKQVESKKSLFKKLAVYFQVYQDNDFIQFVKDAERKEDMTLLKKATALKRKREETEHEIKELEDILGVLKAKKTLLD